MTHQLVVARYAETLDWLAEVPGEFEIWVYNKGKTPISDAALARANYVIARENEGREAETYLSHMAAVLGASHARAKDGFVVFAQGDPFEHSPDFLALLGAWRDWTDLQPLSWRWQGGRDIPPSHILARETGEFLNGLRLRSEHFCLQSWSPLGFHDVGTHWLQQTYRQIHGLPEGINIAAHFLGLSQLPELAAQAEMNLLGRFAYGAIFAARGTLLDRLPAPSLAHLRQAALGHAVYGYVLERLWLHLLGEPFALPASVPASSQGSCVGMAVGPGGNFVPPDKAAGRPTLPRRLLRTARRLAQEKFGDLG